MPLLPISRPKRMMRVACWGGKEKGKRATRGEWPILFSAAGNGQKGGGCRCE